MKNILLSIFLLFTLSLTSQTWETLGDAPVGRHHPISFAIDGKGYAVTGTSSSGDPTDDAYEYDPVTDTWTKLTDFPGAARSFGIGVVAENGKAYIGFGATDFTYLNDLWSFEASTGTWTQLADCSCTGRRHPAMLTIDNKIYVGLGDGALGDLETWAVYNIDTDTWTDIADLPGPPRHHPYMFNAGGELFAGLGHSGPTIYKDWYQLNTTTDTWTALTDFPGEARVAGTQFNIGNYGYVLSGDGDNHDYMDTGEMWRYDPSDDSWLQFPSHPGRSKWAPGSFVIDNDIYFFGGLDRFSNVYHTSVWKYADTTTTVVSPPPTSIDENKVFENTFAYPNPAKDFVLFKMHKRITEYKIYNLIGQLVLENNSLVTQLNTKDFVNGLYVVHFYDKNKRVKTSKVLIQH